MDKIIMGTGAVKQPIDLRDYRLELIPGAEILPPTFSLKDKVGKIKTQASSGSCVGQSFSYYAEVINTFETGLKTALSARDIYSLIHLPEGGAWLRDAAKKICNSGVVTEEDAPSYDNGQLPTEDFMRSRDDITPQEEEEGMTYWAKTFVTWDNRNFETFKKAIFQGKGCVLALEGNNYCWGSNYIKNGIIITPDSHSQCTWAHALYMIGFCTIDGVEYLEGVNSWGEHWGDGGFFYLPKSYIDKGLVFNAFTLVDLPNQTYSLMQKQISILRNLIDIMKQLIAKFKK